jgi:hypothetical protein
MFRKAIPACVLLRKNFWNGIPARSITKIPLVICHYTIIKLRTVATETMLSEPNLEDYRVSGDHKPPYSYAALICMAMGANSNKMTLSAIYKWIRDNFLYYRNADPSWQVR